MNDLTEIKVEGNQIWINDKIIYNFEDRYHNISALGVEQQIQIFSRLLDSISKANLSISEKDEIILICAYLFRILSEKNAPTAILTIGNNYLINIMATIIDLFNNANKLYHICDINNFKFKDDHNNLISIVASKFCGTDFLSDNNFAAVLVDLDFVKNNICTVLSECNRLLDRNGIIICYGSSVFRTEILNVFLDENVSLYQFSGDRLIACINTSNEKYNVSKNSIKNSIKEEILKIIEQKKSEFFEKLKYIMSNRPTSLSDLWYSIIDDCIYIIDEIESIIAKNYMLFENEDLKYQTNEVKNALLDFKYEAYLNRKHYDFFQANLLECYNDWVANFQ